MTRTIIKREWITARQQHPVGSPLEEVEVVLCGPYDRPANSKVSPEWADQDVVSFVVEDDDCGFIEFQVSATELYAVLLRDDTTRVVGRRASRTGALIQWARGFVQTG